MPEPFELFVTDSDGGNPDRFSTEHLLGTIVASGIDRDTAIKVASRITERLELANVRRVARDDLRDLMSLSLRETHGFLPTEDVRGHVRTIAARSSELERGGTAPRRIVPTRIAGPAPDLGSPLERLASALPLVEVDIALPAAELRLEMNGTPRLVLDTYLRPEEEGTILFVHDAAVPMAAFCPVVPNIGFDRFEFELGIVGL